ncbi:hypothetical protein BU23DRAFT_175457 [Bimuria novae-zelandiae CBS 107.79]|uniref:Uncharacterized protein n=1 Tax=Bimuria novae-zelandiae CBS 107.79 TaxID=1447943 RepID=A0A6A5V346_9PLEO|nr:hypothetical protein BU23DRAFT_175457 [Bimuria novae-zelandiae CBS 107.79]
MDSSHLSMVPGPTVGRFIVVEIMSPEIVLALHMALEYYFTIPKAIDLYAGWSTLAKRTQNDELIREGTRRVRHYTIDFLYVVVHADRVKLSSWHKQRTSPLYDDKFPADSYVGRGTTVLQLSEELRSERSEISDTFRPWNILVLPAMPRLRNWREDQPLKDTRFANSAEAWAWAIWNEHNLAYDEMYNLFSNISDKVSPPKDFMYNLNHIDKLIFDDENYTKSKLYFWAYQSLEIIQSKVMTIIRRWIQYRPHLEPTQLGRVGKRGRMALHIARMQRLIDDMDACIEDFRDFVKDCKAKQHEIAALRDGLFNGSAVLESRNSLRTADQSLEQTKTAIAQGENIKVLTLVSIFFLPLAFVTSVFGMTNLPESGNMKAFAISLVCICVPAYLVIGTIMDLWRPTIQWLLNQIPPRWRSPRFHVFRTMALRSMTRETARMALVSVKPHQSKIAEKASRPSYTEANIATLANESDFLEKKAQENQGGIGTGTQETDQSHSEPNTKTNATEGHSIAEVLDIVAKVSETLTNQHGKSPFGIAGFDSQKWNLKPWNRSSNKQNLGSDRDIELAEGSHPK